MQDIFIVMLVIMAALAITDLVVGVSNDAVNFLGSAVGSKASTFKIIMIIASIGVACGAVFSNGMMEVARKGVFFPNMFLFEEIMVIFMAVMITDVILLDIFNSLGLPTSTTVSLVFELLGAAVAISVYKVYNSPDLGGSVFATLENIVEIDKYINQDKALLMISGILAVVFFAFFAGAIVQWIVRYLFTFRYERHLKTYGGIVGGVAFTAIAFFMIFKGSKGTTLISNEAKMWISQNMTMLLIFTFIICTALSQFVVSVLKRNVLKLIVLVGTFSLAMAFAGNDLVNFIGVPLAAASSYQAWIDAGKHNIFMDALNEPAQTPIYYLLLAGLVMVITLWLSKKAKNVLKTSIDLSKYETTDEKHVPSRLAKIIVRVSIWSNKMFCKILPDSFLKTVDERFYRPSVSLPINKDFEAPAFDLVRASVNVIVPAILISIGTNSTLPLSTTYVTFMVAMGTSLADNAWGRESAVYRVTGVIKVIMGWFATAIIAFCAAAVFATLINIFGLVAVVALLVIGVILITSSKVYKKNKAREERRKKLLRTAQQGKMSLSEVIEESSVKIADFFNHANKLYYNITTGLVNHDRATLRRAVTEETELKEDIVQMQNSIFYIIRSVDETGIEASRFYILIIDYLKDINRSLSSMSSASFMHVDNNHKELKDHRKEDIKHISSELCEILKQVEDTFNSKNFSNIKPIVERKNKLKQELNMLIETQINKIRNEELSPKNSQLFFSVLLESKDLLKTSTRLLQLANEFYVNKKSSEQDID